MVIVHLPGICLFGSLPLLSFFLLLSILFSLFSLANFGPAYIKSFNSVMWFVGIIFDKSFTFLWCFGLDCPPVLDPERKQCGFLFRYGSSNGIYIIFSSLESEFAFVCLRGMDDCQVVFG